LPLLTFKRLYRAALTRNTFSCTPKNSAEYKYLLQAICYLLQVNSYSFYSTRSLYGFAGSNITRLISVGRQTMVDGQRAVIRRMAKRGKIDLSRAQRYDEIDAIYHRSNALMVTLKFGIYPTSHNHNFKVVLNDLFSVLCYGIEMVPITSLKSIRIELLSHRCKVQLI